MESTVYDRATMKKENLLIQRAGYCFFFASGATALMYEIIWLKLLGLIFGNTTFAVSTVLAGFMAGLGLGSYFIGRVIDRWRRPLLTYGLLEIGIGAYAAFTFAIIHIVQGIYVGFAQQVDPGLALYTTLRLIMAFVVIFIPTFCMGATLPVLTKFYIHRAKAIGSGTALLYGVNTAGAVTGTLLTGIWLLPLLGLRGVLILAVTINVLIGVTACLLARADWGIEDDPVEDGEDDPSTIVSPSVLSSRIRWWLPLGLFISGATAMIFEVAWTRVLATVLGSSTYAFTIMLATFLLGLALGSSAFQRVLDRRAATASMWGWLQLTTALAALVALPLYDDVGIATVRIYSLTVGSMGWMQLMLFLLCAALMIVPAFCFGAIFPVSIALYTRTTRTLGQSVGFLYLFNTFGNIVGSLGVGFILIPSIGIHHAILIAALLGAVIGLSAFVVDFRLSFPRVASVGLASLLLVTCLWANREGWDQRFISFGLHVHPDRLTTSTTAEIRARVCDDQILYYREGLSSIVSVAQESNNRYLRVNGKVDASTTSDVRTQLYLGHLPLLMHPNPDDVLIIGFGSGMTLGACLAHSVSHVDCVEIEEAVLEAAPLFAAYNRKGYLDPRTTIVFNDGRNHLLITHKEYDVIISEPSNPWMAGVASLFTREFYELVQGRLSSDGIFCQWLQTYSLDPDDYRMIVATVQSIFPYVTIWKSTTGDTLILAAETPVEMNLANMQKRFNSSPTLREDMAQFDIVGPAGLVCAFELGAKDVREFADSADSLNTDNNLRLEFNAPKFLYKNTSEMINQIVGIHRTQDFPTLADESVSLESDAALLSDMAYGHLGMPANESLAVAEEYFEKAYQLRPQDASVLMGLGRCSLRRGNPNKAVDLLERAALVAPDSIDVQAYLGLALVQVGEIKRGLEPLIETIRMGTQRWEFYKWTGEALEASGMWTAAADAYARSAELNPNRLTFKILQARNLRRAGRLKEAAAILEDLRNKLAADHDIYDELRMTYDEMDRLDLSIAAYEDLVRVNPYRSLYWGHLLRLYERANDKEKVEWAITQGKKYEPLFKQIVEVVLTLDRRKRYEEDVQLKSARSDAPPTPVFKTDSPTLSSKRDDTMSRSDYGEAKAIVDEEETMYNRPNQFLPDIIDMSDTPLDTL